ncbi:major facilitator superfamily domain-containing protein [Ustulina deusta]|nr:major facilitator superfamily domain-containing protein [Ustulina deusta]
MRSYFSDLNAGARRVADEIEYDPQDPDAAIQSVIDRRGLDGFQWRVWWVAASGFFTTSYSIFAVNVIGPALEYVYQDVDCPPSSPRSSLIINLTTLIGTMVGAIVFGFLADRHGRKSVYGIELAIVIVATIGITTASNGVSNGVQNSMNVYGWLGFWRTLLGIGLGAEYPLSSIIAAEWSSTKSRGRMMAAVFLMQSVGQLAAYGFGLAILASVSKHLGLSPEETDRHTAVTKVDVIWRAMVGVGAFPALVSLVLRRTIPETPYYLVETGRVTDAVTAAGQVYAPEVTLQPTGPDGISPYQTVTHEPEEKAKKGKGSWWNNTTEYIREVRGYLSQKSRWRTLLGVMLTWWLLDLAYYGLGLDNPKTISAIWLSAAPITDTDASLICNTNTNIKIYQTLHENIVRNIATISSGTLPGSIIILLAIDYVPRVTWMAWSFVALAALFAVNGGTFFIAFETDKHALTILLYVLAQAIFNLGPNTMTFILPAELFATKFRGTFYGLAAASGKLGAITILLIINFGVYRRNPFLQSSTAFAGTLLGFVPAMLLGAFIAWVWIPEVQFPRGHGNEIARDENMSDDGLDHGLQENTFRMKLKLPNRPLAQIARDPEGGQVLGARRNLRRLIQRIRGSRRRDTTAATLESGADGVSLHPQPSNEHEVQLDSGDLGIWARER